MKITDAERELLERALDEVWPLIRHKALLRKRPGAYAKFKKLHEQASAIVRERPAGARRLRSDFNQPKQYGQQEITIEEPA